MSQFEYIDAPLALAWPTNYRETWRSMVEILSRIGDQPDEAVTSPRPAGEAEELRATDAGPVSIFVDVLDDSWQTASLSRAEDSAAEKQHISAAVSGVKAGS